jgi:hypothetical protein
MASPWLSVAVAVETAVALLLTLVALRSWRHSGSRKVLLLACAFAAFLAKGLLFSVGLFTIPDWGSLLLPGLAFDVVGLALLYLAALRPA